MNLMKLKITEQHSPCGIFPLFTKGTAVTGLQADDEYAIHADAVWGGGSENWVSCVIAGHNTFIPMSFVTGGILNCDYNPTEIEVECGQIVTLLEIVHEWLYVKDENSKVGWLPACKAVSA